MKDRGTVQTTLSGIANKARTQPKYRFRDLYGILEEVFLHDSRVTSGADPGSRIVPDNTKKLKKRNLFVLRFSTNDLRVAGQRKQIAESGKEVLNERALIERTVPSNTS